MPKLRKQRRRKVYRHNVNRKRLRNKLESVGNISCKEIKASWDKSKSVKTNMREMGLAYDPNISIKTRRLGEIQESATESNEWTEEESFSLKPSKVHVAEALEKEAKAPRAKLFRLPKGQVEWITYLMDKYGKDYKAMAKDRKNYYQETWKQLRAKIKRFKSIPEQYSVYAKARNINLIDDAGERSDSECSSDGEL